jgi:hypothetical protein
MKIQVKKIDVKILDAQILYFYSISLDHFSSISASGSDKGSAVVIMDAEFYKNKIMSMLTDEEFYKA